MESHRRGIRHELAMMQRGLADFATEVGVNVSWYEFDPSRTTSSDVYDEGPIPNIFDPTLPQTYGGLAFRPPVKIKCVWWRYLAPSNIQTQGGEYTVSTSTLRFPSSSMGRAGLHRPMAPEAHLNDRYFFQGRLYRVESYAPRGQIYGTFIMVDVAGTELMPQELQTNVAISEPEGTPTPWTPGEMLDMPDVTPETANRQWGSPDAGTQGEPDTAAG